MRFRMPRGGMVFFLFFSLSALPAAEPPAPAASPGKPRNVILMIGDGMGMVQLSAAKIHKGRLAVERMVHGGCTFTQSLQNFVTDSSAAATALATGYLTLNGQVGMTADGKLIKTVLEYAEEEGKWTGLVATCRITHATPASMVAHVKSRGSEQEIASQIAGAGVEVLFGGGWDMFLPTRKKRVGLTPPPSRLAAAGAESVSNHRLTPLPPAPGTRQGSLSRACWVGRRGGGGRVSRPGYRPRCMCTGEGRGRLRLPHKQKDEACLSNSCSGSESTLLCSVGTSGIPAPALLTAADPVLQGLDGKPYGMRRDGKDLLAEMAKKGYRSIRTAAEMSLASSGPPAKIIGLFHSGPMPKITDGRSPSLSAMTLSALEILSQSPRGFFLMVEGSQIDWGGHANDFGYNVAETADFDSAVGTVLDFLEDAGIDDETLVVVTADHETGGLSLHPNLAMPMGIEPKWSTKGHTPSPVPVFSEGPASEIFSGAQSHEDIGRKLIRSVSGKPVEFVYPQDKSLPTTPAGPAGPAAPAAR